MSFPSPRHHTDHHEVPALFARPLRADKISTANVQDTVDHPAGFLLRPRMIVRCTHHVHSRSTHHALAFLGEIVTVKLSNILHEPIAELTLLYIRQDLDTEVLADSTIDNGTAVAIHGQYQVVRSSTKIHVYAAQITEVVQVVRLDLALLRVPYLAAGTLWLREDILLNVDRHMFTVNERPMVRICRRSCRRRNLFALEDDVLRFCGLCRQWYHIDCAPRLQTVAHYRTQNNPSLPAWLTWKLPAHSDRTVEPDFVQIVTLPIQRNYPDLFPARIVSFEMLLGQVREDILEPDWTYPTTADDQRRYIQALIRRFTIPEEPLARWHALDDFIKLMSVPLTDRYLYQCPRGSDHLM
ncbi:hypothetical protein C8T65DRAFT_749156 [Cerioporus squamosus]|nr:hypothetical protein C8T65DRAFT_749156 [Cerioporus squamosus]